MLQSTGSQRLERDLATEKQEFPVLSAQKHYHHPQRPREQGLRDLI